MKYFANQRRIYPLRSPSSLPTSTVIYSRPKAAQISFKTKVSKSPSEYAVDYSLISIVLNSIFASTTGRISSECNNNNINNNYINDYIKCSMIVTLITVSCTVNYLYCANFSIPLRVII